MKKAKLFKIIIEGHKREEVVELFEEIQNKYSLYDNCVFEEDINPENTILDKDRYEETGRLSINKKIVKRYGYGNG